MRVPLPPPLSGRLDISLLPGGLRIGGARSTQLTDSASFWSSSCASSATCELPVDLTASLRRLLCFHPAPHTPCTLGGLRYAIFAMLLIASGGRPHRVAEIKRTAMSMLPLYGVVNAQLLLIAVRCLGWHKRHCAVPCHKTGLSTTATGKGRTGIGPATTAGVSAAAGTLVLAIRQVPPYWFIASHFSVGVPVGENMSAWRAGCGPGVQARSKSLTCRSVTPNADPFPIHRHAEGRPSTNLLGLLVLRIRAPTCAACPGTNAVMAVERQRRPRKAAPPQ